MPGVVVVVVVAVAAAAAAPAEDDAAFLAIARHDAADVQRRHL